MLISEQTAHAPARRLERFHQFDGLRAVACLLVLAAHSLVGPVGHYLEALGWRYLAVMVSMWAQSGVDLFFVLSGVVLLRPYVRNERPFAAGDYFRRRAQRLLPPYWAVLGLSVPLVAAAGWFPNWYSRQILPPFDWLDPIRQLGIVNFGGRLYNGAWWSLQVEVLFYLLAPVVVLILRRHRLATWHVAAILITFLFVAETGHLLIRDNAWEFNIYTLPIFLLRYALCFAAGTMLAKRDFSSRVGLLSVVLGLAWVLAYPYWPRLCLAVGFGFFYAGILILALDRDARLGKILAHPLLVWIGERSYSIFLIHFTVFYAVDFGVACFTADRSWVYGILTRGIGIPGALLGAMALFYLVERRFARGLVSADHFWPTSYLAAASHKTSGAAPESPAAGIHGPQRDPA